MIFHGTATRVPRLPTPKPYVPSPREQEVRDARAAQDARIAELRLAAQQRFNSLGLPRLGGRA